MKQEQNYETLLGTLQASKA